jgi:competence protein ComEA
MFRALFTTLVLCFMVFGAASVAAQSQSTPSTRPAATVAAVVNLNTATSAQIASLPGVGEKVAQRIIEYREKNGGFTKVEQLMNVKGIGEKSFLKLKSLVTVGEKPAAKQ